MSLPESATDRLIAALPSVQRWNGRPAESDLTALPGCPAVYLLIDGQALPVLLATTQHLRRLTISRLSDPEQPRKGRADLAEVVRGVRWRRVHCPFEARWWYYQLAREMHVREYRRLVSFGPAWFLHVDWERDIPEIRVTDRIWRDSGVWIGPWPTQRSCQQALEGLWDLFDLCRYPEQVRRAPRGKRCAYADMGRCDAPCDGTVPLTAYTERSRAAWEFASGDAPTWMAAAQERMHRAAAEQRYEQAGQIKQQLRFAETWRRDWSPKVRNDAELNDLLVIPVTRRRAWKLFLFRRGHLEEGPILRDRQLPTQAPQWLAEQLAHEPQSPDPVVRMEQTWLAAHFLNGKEADRSIVMRLQAGQIPPDCCRHIEDVLRTQRAAKTESDTDPSREEPV